MAEVDTTAAEPPSAVLARRNESTIEKVDRDRRLVLIAKGRPLGPAGVEIAPAPNCLLEMNRFLETNDGRR